MFGISAEKLFIIALITVLVIGPTRLPEYAAKFSRLIREVRRMANGAQEQLKEQLGPDFQDIDWKKLDPRQYDPRRIIREALLSDGDEEPTPLATPPPPATPASKLSTELPRLQHAQRTPYDIDAT